MLWTNLKLQLYALDEQEYIRRQGLKKHNIKAQSAFTFTDMSYVEGWVRTLMYLSQVCGERQVLGLRGDCVEEYVE
jgi:hypothetical protein